ncbi:hypothetical protein ACFLYR_01605 [Chloroflexota bacterium]
MKALATILVWVLWLSGMVMGFSTLIIGIIAGDLFNPGQLEPMVYPASFAASGFFGLVALYGMKIRKDL